MSIKKTLKVVNPDRRSFKAFEQYALKKLGDHFRKDWNMKKKVTIEPRGLRMFEVPNRDITIKITVCNATNFEFLIQYE